MQLSLQRRLRWQPSLMCATPTSKVATWCHKPRALQIGSARFATHETHVTSIIYDTLQNDAICTMKRNGVSSSTVAFSLTGSGPSHNWPNEYCQLQDMKWFCFCRCWKGSMSTRAHPGFPSLGQWRSWPSLWSVSQKTSFSRRKVGSTSPDFSWANSTKSRSK